MYIERTKMVLKIYFPGENQEYDNLQLSMVLTLGQVMFNVKASYGYYTYEMKKFTLEDAVQTEARVPGYRFDVK